MGQWDLGSFDCEETDILFDCFPFCIYRMNPTISTYPSQAFLKIPGQTAVPKKCRAVHVYLAG